MGVVVVGEVGGEAGVVFDEDGVALIDEGLGAGGGEGDAVFELFDFFGDADDHGGGGLGRTGCVSVIIG